MSNLRSESRVSTFKSRVEDAIVNSNLDPVPIHETATISANGERGIWANRCEICAFKGDVPIGQYPINQDSCPHVIKKQSRKVHQVQPVAVKYLKPPTPAPPGQLVIRREPNKPTAPAPPVVIRQVPPKPATPAPLVIREAPPPPPPRVPEQLVTIPGKQLPAPPRKVVVERLAPIPPKPQPVIIERWLPYTEQKRRVIYQPAPPDPVVVKPRNVVVEWQPPEVSVTQDVQHLGVTCADPEEYARRYGCTMKNSADLPQFVKDIAPPCGVKLAADHPRSPCAVNELEGDVCALQLIDLNKEGLAAYSSQLCPCPPRQPTPAPAPPVSQPCPCFTSTPYPCPGSSPCKSPTPSACLASTPCPCKQIFVEY